MTVILQAHLRKLLDERTRQLRKHWRIDTADDSTKAIHDLRVASRRLRALGHFASHLAGHAHARSANGHSAIDKRLAKVMRAVGRVRDWDVLIARLDARYLRATTELEGATTELERATLEHLLERFGGKRTRAERRARRMLARIDVVELCHDVRADFDEAVMRLPTRKQELAGFVRDLLLRRVVEVVKRTPVPDGKERPEELHRMRIGVKQLRYVLELCEPAMGARYKTLHARVTALQELLGEHHDLVVLGERVDRLRATLKRRKRLVLASGVHLLAVGIAAERKDLFRRYQAEGFSADEWCAALAQLSASARRVARARRIRGPRSRLRVS